MSDPKEQRHDSDELELEAETVKDLDLASADANEVRGGKCVAGTSDSINCPSNYTN